ncbi:VOC family protein [Pseudomonas sp. FFUP_PS_473]|jgi:catechol 2,3-dioxygenase-like lactoylglutathione lyase family enzyme|uniref:VOC family protein n=1 Tax=unclassified Pseudomonas TaxID=196821 RepID=UPI000C19F8A9|nr:MULTISPECIES: VOC family protein [unclassified Pseudomonas]ATR82882.1 glyoxalase [Pseudomonas sp. HLS-6]MEE3635378.1 VOC family protein [Pseudomonas sp. AL 58]PLP88058.1 VOC family protein [Pseudomonas sp. FFUP_PS_473]WJM94798.1 VOC family protein [Pseudomonas defluvii]
MKFAYTILYVPDVASSLAFFEQAFGINRRFLHESGDYGELDTGATTLAFASRALGQANLPEGLVVAAESARPLGMEIALATDTVEVAHAQALACGATELKAPEQKPWGQTVSYLRCPDGLLVELCTPMA